jgi:autotransporter-associated beta strand protein
VDGRYGRQPHRGSVFATAYQLNDGFVSADVSGPGGVTKDTGGTVLLFGSNTCLGDTAVDAGTLVVAALNALPARTNLVVNAGGTVVLAGDPTPTNTFSATPFRECHLIIQIAGKPSELRLSAIEVVGKGWPPMFVPSYSAGRPNQAVQERQHPFGLWPGVVYNGSRFRSEFISGPTLRRL